MGRWSSLIAAVLLAALLGAQTAAAAKKAKVLKGQLPASAKTLRPVAVSTEGTAVLATVDAATGAFSFALTAGKTYTVSLLTNAGTYYGPVQCRPVCASAKKAKCTASIVMTFKASGDMGELAVNPGYASVAKAKQRVCDRGLKKIVARAEGGVVVGATHLGLVKKPSSRLASDARASDVAPQAQGKGDPLEPGKDQDGDGIVGAFDVDDNGNGVVDNTDGGQALPDIAQSFYVFANYKVELGGAQNVYCPQWNETKAEATFKSTLQLAMQNKAPPGSPVTVSEARLECNGLPYCKSGGGSTGKWVKSMNTEVAFPDDPQIAYDATKGGGLMPTLANMPDFQLKPYATFSEINAGDTFIGTATISTGEKLVLPGILNFVPKTTPLVLSYAVNGGAEVQVFYPPTAGTRQVPIAVTKSARTSVRVTLARPQRSPIGNETAPNGWVDLGGMTWQVWGQIQSGAGGGMHQCQSSTYSSAQATCGTSGCVDNSPDTPTGTPKSPPASPIIFDVDVSGCLEGGDPSAPGGGGAVTWGNSTAGCIAFSPRTLYNDNSEVQICFTRSLP